MHRHLYIKNIGAWFKFIPNGSGSVSVRSFKNENENSFFAVYDETCSELISDGNENEISFYANKFIEYHVYATVDFVINLNEYENCSGANEIRALPFSYEGSTVGYPSIDSGCVNKKVRGMWFKINGNNGKIFITLTRTSSTASRLGISLEVYEQCNSAQPETCIDYIDSIDDLRSMILNTSSKNTYYIFAGSPASNSDGLNFTLSVTLYDEECERGTLITKFPCSFSGNTAYKNESMRTCLDGLYTARKGAWFHYVHDEVEEKMISVSTCNRETNKIKARIEVYPSCNENRCLVKGYYDTRINCSVAIFRADPGEEYNVFVTDEEMSVTGEYFVDFFNMSAQNYSECSRPDVHNTLPFAMIDNTMLSSLSWDECSNEYRQGYWISVYGNGKTFYATTRGAQTNFKTSISVYSGCPNETKRSHCIDYSESEGDSFETNISWKTNYMHPYYIFVSGPKGASGIFTLKVFEAEASEGLKCITPIPIFKTQPIRYASTVYASYSNSSCNPKTLRKGVWFLVSGDNRWIHLSTCDTMTDFKTKIEVYLVCNGRENSGIACVRTENDGSCGSKDVVSFRGGKNTNYWVFVTAREGAVPETGFFSLNISSGEHFLDLDKPVFFYIIIGYSSLFAFFSCIGFVTALVVLIVACVRRNRISYLKIVN